MHVAAGLNNQLEDYSMPKLLAEAACTYTGRLHFNSTVQQAQMLSSLLLVPRQHVCKTLPAGTHQLVCLGAVFPHLVEKQTHSAAHTGRNTARILLRTWKVGMALIPASAATASTVSTSTLRKSTSVLAVLSSCCTQENMC